MIYVRVSNKNNECVLCTLSAKYDCSRNSVEFSVQRNDQKVVLSTEAKQVLEGSVEREDSFISTFSSLLKNPSIPNLLSSEEHCPHRTSLAIFYMHLCVYERAVDTYIYFIHLAWMFFYFHTNITHKAWPINDSNT